MTFFKRHRYFFISAIMTVLLAGGLSLPSVASIMLAPKRIVFDGRARSATLVVLNTSRETKTFQLSWKMISVDENGSAQNVPLVEGPHSVSKMVVFSPRRVTIEPNGRQNVRLSLRRPGNLPPGEYRSHLVFSSNPGEEEETNMKSPSRGVKLALRIGIGMSIPVIVRQGDVAPQGLNIEDVGVTADANGNQVVSFSLAHIAGKGASSYGNIKLYLKKADDREEKIIGAGPNISLYVEQSHRKIKIATTQPIPSNSRLRIVYEGSDEYTGRILAEKAIQIK